MINGAHIIISSKKPEADRAFFRDVFGLPHVDAGQGWLIFGLPPAEVAVHPSDKNGKHQLYFMCKDVLELIRQMSERGVTCKKVRDEGWGLVTHIKLPGGSKLGVYQPRHARPQAASASDAKAASTPKTKTKPKTKPQRKPTPAKKATRKASKKRSRK